ncbi:hypothetical protein BSIN_0034 [Burkholderia singularis]|uniref:Uncharacterized protein n=1 Tax=Burkholderia singularis TaxID=1503053 RepID=A0A238H227_9BURK|nr:hypothetical protein BSIN_0034 [Burkholderia singularis]
MDDTVQKNVDVLIKNNCAGELIAAQLWIGWRVTFVTS